ncbi:MAG: hypothetical protein NWE85_02550 [Candidatus Bathyarchaeota archaeon]|nr:hypothetical protein [Candidatus Bathyarchaeota archaeon]
MKTQKQIWQDINEPKIEGLITSFDENGKLVGVFLIVDRVPLIRRKRK